MPVTSLVVDSMFNPGENVTIAHFFNSGEFKQLLLACSGV
jgi:hypothetical protein